MMNRKIIHRIITLIQHLFVPLRKMLHKRCRRTTDCRFNGLVNPFHGLRGFVAKNTVTERILLPGPQLPRTIHLVSQIPGLNTVRFFMTVLFPKLGPIGPPFMVGIFHKVHGILHGSGSKIHRVQRLRTYLLGPLKILIMPHLVGNILVPGRIKMNLSFGSWSNGILPLPGRDKIASRKSDSRNLR